MLNTQQKIKSRESLAKIVSSLKKRNKKIVHTNGAYDLLHAGHIYTLQKAKELGDILIVSINSDDSVRKYKGLDRPILSQDERAILLSSIEYVDYVTIFSEDNILKTLEILKPDYQVKGGSFLEDRIKKEKELIAGWGGKFVSFELLGNYSTTNIIKKILNLKED